jgi:uncharacterized protein (DUF983 family)
MTQTATQTLLRGLSRKCPKCGVGSLFSGYLTRRDACPHCGENLEGLDADDGPAWLTIGVVAHIVVPLLIFMEREGTVAYGVEIAVVLLATIVLTLAILPLSKGVFVAALWRIRRAR